MSWDKLRLFTQARIGQKRIGHSLATDEVLRFQRAHAEARDAVWTPWDYSALPGTLAFSQAHDRAEYLRRPDLGRRLRAPVTGQAEIVFVVSDGLSARAVATHFLPLWNLLAPKFPEAILYKVPFARVAIADEIGAQCGARLSVIFIGERPGLSAPDSLGIYLTFAPRVGRNDAERNCISNVRTPGGLSYAHAAEKLETLMRNSLTLGLSGVALKEGQLLEKAERR